MPDNPQTLADTVRAIHKALSFAAKNNFANLKTVKGLDSLLPALARQTQNNTCPETLSKNMLSIAKNFEQFYDQTLNKQREIIANTLEILNNIKQLDETSNTVVQHNNDTPDLHSCLQQLARPVTDLPGVGPKTAAALARLNARTFEDLLYLVPRSYIDRRRIVPIDQIEPGADAVVIGSVKGSLAIKSTGRLRLLEMLISDGSAVMAAKWFRLSPRYAALLKKQYTDGDRVMITGTTKSFGNRIEIHHPEIELLEPDEDPRALLSIAPLYPLTEGLTQKTMQRIMQALSLRIPDIVSEYLPNRIRSTYKLISLQDAFSHVHQPHTDDNLDQLNNTTSHYHRRIVFDEFFLLQTMLALKKKGVALEQGVSLAITDYELNTLIDGLPFGLTSAQMRVLQEIRLDMADGVPMHRLLQGDVGSGKTVISLIAACIAVQNGCQAAIMAPTEILAEQHYTTIKNLALARDLQIVMLTGKQPKAARTENLAAISNGSAQIILGTHALIQEAVIFNRLGLVVVDEQHKFGVLQRARFKKKGGNPDILVMTATPIPRTLGLTVYGDLDVSIIDELPPGRTPVTTRLYNESRRQDVYELVSRTISNGNQAFIVYPLVDTSEKLDLRDATRMAAHLQQDIFPDLRIALLHGRMDSAEKESVMQAFSAGHTHILVATTVVEVGIDVPNAALMIIEHAERFGLSQLHQLRGRVGRGAAESLCVLLAQFSRSDDARKRLRIMEQTNDGFKIAEEDFNIRGPGEFLGTRQSGLPDFRVAHIGRDIRILQEARSAAFELVDQDPRLESPENQPFKNILAERWKGRLKLAGIG